MGRQQDLMTFNQNYSSMLSNLSHRLFTLCFKKCGPQAESQPSGRRALSYLCIKARDRRPIVAAIVRSHSSQFPARYLRTFSWADCTLFSSVKGAHTSPGSRHVGQQLMQSLHYDCWQNFIVSLTNHCIQHSLI